MRGTRWAGLAVVLAAALGSGRAADDDKTYDLRGPAPRKGQTFTTTNVLRVKDADVTIKTGGTTLKMKQTMTATTEEEEKFLEVDGRTVTKSRAKIVKDRLVIVADFMGNAMKEEHTHGLEGETILSERLGAGKWKHALVDNKPTEKQKKELLKRLGPENDDALFPADKVKVGHTWTVDAAELKRFFGNSVTQVKGTVKQTFVKVENVNGQPCAVIRSEGSIKGKMRDDEGEPTQDVEMELKLTGWREITSGLEVKMMFEGRIRIAGKQKLDGAEAEVTLDGVLSGESTTKEK